MSGPFGAALSGWLALIFQRGRFALAPSWCSRGPQQAPQWELFAGRKTFSFRRSARRPFFQCRGCRRHIILAGPRGKLGPALNLLRWPPAGRRAPEVAGHRYDPWLILGRRPRKSSSGARPLRRLPYMLLEHQHVEDCSASARALARRRQARCRLSAPPAPRASPHRGDTWRVELARHAKLGRQVERCYHEVIDPFDASHQANTPVIPSRQCTKRCAINQEAAHSLGPALRKIIMQFNAPPRVCNERTPAASSSRRIVRHAHPR
jgi:hypothetical protein